MCWQQENFSVLASRTSPGPPPRLSTSTRTFRHPPSAALQRSGWLPRAALTPLELVNARTLLAVGDWNGSATSLTSRPLFSGRLLLRKS